MEDSQGGDPSARQRLLAADSIKTALVLAPKIATKRNKPNITNEAAYQLCMELLGINACDAFMRARAPP